MNSDMAPSSTWLTLAQAAQQLDIHPTTLRRWADNGDIPVMRTPGGHRRFAATDVANLASRQYGRFPSNLHQLWAEQALAHTRQELSVQDDSWLAVGDNKLRQRHRQLGRELMALTLQYISAPEENDHLLAQARHVGQQYGQMAQQSGLVLTEALQAALFFRDTLLEAAFTLPEDVHIQPQTNMRLIQRINHLLNTVHLAIAACYDSVNN
ncbi:MAG: helix-turn-helix domain-containing protein [Chloroflexota bacterium]|jgi:excisionase family DNA binding protein